jgi:NAD-dependent DNA ligase
MNLYTRQAAAFRNEMRHQCGALLGIVQGILADGAINDAEIKFLRDWLRQADNVRLSWPGDVIYAQVESALADGVITTEERAHLSNVLQKLVGGTLDELADNQHVSELAFDEVQSIQVADRSFCLTGDFAYGPRNRCQDAVTQRGGIVLAGITKKLQHLVVGGLGSPEWKHGAFGTKIEKAMEYKRSGLPLLIVHEDVWAAAMFG